MDLSDKRKLRWLLWETFEILILNFLKTEFSELNSMSILIGILRFPNIVRKIFSLQNKNLRLTEAKKKWLKKFKMAPEVSFSSFLDPLSQAPALVPSCLSFLAPYGQASLLAPSSSPLLYHLHLPYTLSSPILIISSDFPFTMKLFLRIFLLNLLESTTLKLSLLRIQILNSQFLILHGLQLNCKP